MGKPVPTLREKVREVLRLKHYSPKTEESYLPWIRQYLRYHKLRHPRELGGKEVKDFLAHLRHRYGYPPYTADSALDTTSAYNRYTRSIIFSTVNSA